MRILDWQERPDVYSDSVPNHVAIIMDGNRRWAAARGISAPHAHLHCSEALSSTIREAHFAGISHLTLFALSSANLGRSEKELELLLRFSAWLWTEDVVQALRETRSRVDLIGGIDSLTSLKNELGTISQFTVTQNPELHVRFALNYSSRSEIADASFSAHGVDQVRRDLTDSYPDVALLIRTAGEQRLSDFLLWEIAHAELVFIDTLWPDFRGIHLASTIYEYRNRNQKHGR